MVNRTHSSGVISTPEAPLPGGHYSQAIVAGNLVFVSGQLPLDGRGRAPEGYDFEAQTRLALTNVFAILRGAGGAPADIVKTTAYIVGIERWPQFNEVYADVFGSHRPARSVVPVAGLHHGVLVEIEAIAVVPDARVEAATGRSAK